VSAALRLAEAGADVVLLDANTPGWGASGRNGGLVSVGGSKLSDEQIIKRAGATDAQIYFGAERAAVDMVEFLIETHGLDIDRHSEGYTYVAHSPSRIPDVRAYGEQYFQRYGLPAEFLNRDQMVEQGLNSPDFHAATNLPIGFALNPLKFILGLTSAAEQAGIRMFSNTEVQTVTEDNGYVLSTPQGRVRASKLLFATNGYSSDNLPSALASRYLPVQSNILVTRPLTEDEIATQGWFSRQFVCDSRMLLHYFRLLPDNRMMLGLRGSVRSTSANLERTRRRARMDFDRMFPAWRHVETEYFWSGLICMTRDLMPFAGAIDGMENAFAALAYHGNGVTMAPYCGALMADIALGRKRLEHPDIMQRRLPRFELGRWRRASLPPAFAWYKITDNL
jgi:glycine/D-amino acid oxidase-like deaminating enzyme